MSESMMPTSEELKKIQGHIKKQAEQEDREMTEFKQAGLTPERWHEEHQFDPETGEDISTTDKEY